MLLRNYPHMPNFSEIMNIIYYPTCLKQYEVYLVQRNYKHAAHRMCDIVAMCDIVLICALSAIGQFFSIMKTMSKVHSKMMGKLISWLTGNRTAFNDDSRL